MGRRLRQERKRIGLSQTEFVSRLGASKQLASHWENGRSEITSFDLARLHHLGVDIAFVATGIPVAGSGLKMRLPAGVVAFCTTAQLIEIAAGKLDLADVEAKRVTYATCSARSLSFEIPPECRSMEPRLKPGMVVTIDPEKRPTAGDIVVVVVLQVGRELLIGRYRPGSGKAGNTMSQPYSLLFDNTAFFEPRAVSAKDKPVFMGTLVEDVSRSSR